jgi:hypothetical protein
MIDYDHINEATLSIKKMAIRYCIENNKILHINIKSENKILHISTLRMTIRYCMQVYREWR